MQQQSDWILGVGCVTLLATLALSMPGVQAVRADDKVVEVSAATAASGPSCEAASVANQPVIRIQLPRTAAANQDPDSVPIALNGSGNDYGPSATRTAVHPDKR
jgi:hypothetical protein